MRYTALLLCTGALWLGCEQPQRLGGESALDPRRSSPAVELAPVQLNPVVLRSHADYDAWEDAVIARSGPMTVYALYKEALSRRRGDQRTFVRWVLLAHQDDFNSEFREPLYRFVDGLASGENISPDVRYLLGFLAWYQLTSAPGQPEALLGRIDPVQADLVATNWGKLVNESPKWIGPGGVVPADLVAKMKVLEKSAEAPAAFVPQPVEANTVGGWVLGEVMNEYKGQAPWAERYVDAQAKLSRVYEITEDKGEKKGCEQMDSALMSLNDVTRMGDAYAHCAIFRQNPYGAIEQLRRMAAQRIPGGLPAVLSRLRATAKNDARLMSAVEDLELELRQHALKAPVWAERCGLLLWFGS